MLFLLLDDSWLYNDVTNLWMRRTHCIITSKKNEEDFGSLEKKICSFFYSLMHNSIYMNKWMNWMRSSSLFDRESNNSFTVWSINDF